MITAARSQHRPAVGLQFGPDEFAVLSIPDEAVGTVVVLAPSGRSRRCSDSLAALLNDEQLGTLCLSLPLAANRSAAATVIAEVAGRLGAVLDWMRTKPELDSSPIGCLGVGPGAAAVLRAAATEPAGVDAVVTVAGWTELVDAEIPLVEAPTLLVEGTADRLGLDRAWRALRGLGGDADVKTVPGVNDPMETEAGRREVAALAGQWFRRAFAAAASSPTWRLAHDRRDSGEPLDSLFF